MPYTAVTLDDMAGGTQSAAEEPRRPASRHSLRTFSQRAWGRAAEVAARRMAPLAASSLPQPEPVPAAPPEEVLDLLRHLGITMSRAGEPADRVASILGQIATVYGATGLTFFVVPTGVFVRIDLGPSSSVDFETGASTPLRLNQVDALYRLIDDIRLTHVDAHTASARLQDLLTAEPRFSGLAAVLGSGVLTVGLGLMLNPTASAVPAFLFLGVLVGMLRWWADREPILALVLPVVAAIMVTWLVFKWLAPVLDASALDIVIPSLVTFLPGAALTMATVELSTGDMLAGSARLVYGLERLLLLTFGITMGAQLAGLAPSTTQGQSALGAWAPWLGVLVFGAGQYVASSAPRRTLGWLLLVLYTAYGVQALSGRLLGSLGASFLAAAVVLPVCYAIQSRRSGPPVPVTFLPTFWLLVPGALGLAGVAQIVGVGQAAGLGDFLNALLSIIAIAVGVLVGSGVSERIGRATSTWRGI